MGISYKALVLFLLFLATPCNRPGSISNGSQEAYPSKEEIVRFYFDIILKEISNFKDMKITDYHGYYLPAILKQTNTSDTALELHYPRLITFENYEIRNIRELNRDHLIHHYDYSIIYDPLNSESNITKLNPNEFIVDTLNLASDLNLYLSEADTLLIRLKKRYFNEIIYSNWDTLFIK